MRFKSRSRALAASALAASLGLAGLGLVAPPAQASETTTSVRVEGQFRYETAVAVSQETFDASTDVVLATGEDYADALAGNGLAGHLNAPVLLTPTDTLYPATLAEIERLGADNVWIMGGTEAISASVEAALDAAGYNTERRGGINRIETAVDIAEEIGAANIGDTMTDQRTAIVVRAFNFPDAVSASSAAFAETLPVLLTNSDDLSDSTDAALTDLGIERVLVLGGTDAVSADIVTEIEADGITVDRFAGDFRYDTAIDFAQDFLMAELGWAQSDGSGYDLATGEKFPDALAAGPHAGTNEWPIILTPSETVYMPVATFLAANCEVFDIQAVIGGEAAVAEDVAVAHAEAAQCDLEGNQAFAVSPGDEAVNFVSTSNVDNTGRRSYEVNGLVAGEDYEVALVDASTVVVATDGTVAFTSWTLTTESTIELINGTSTGAPAGGTESQQETAEAMADGSITFAIDSDSPDQVIPVVFLDAGTTPNGSLGLNADGTPSELFAIGGQKNWVPTEALATDTGGAVSAVNYNLDYFIAAGDTYFYDGNDVFRYQGGADVSMAVFEGMLTAGDTVAVTYDPDTGDTSIFNVTTDAVPAATNVTATVTDADGDGTQDDVVVAWTASAQPDAVYDVFRSVDADCATAGDNTQIADNVDATTVTDLSVSQTSVTRTYCVTAVGGTTGVASGTTNSATVSVPPTPDTTEPETIVNGAAVDVDSGNDDVANTGDVWVLIFDEDVTVTADATASVSDGTDATIVENGANSTWVADGNKVTITLTAALTDPDPLNYPLTITFGAGIVDAAGNDWTDGAGGLDLTLEDDGPEFVVGGDTSVVVSATQLRLEFNEAVVGVSVSCADFTITTGTCTSVAVSADGLTATITGTGFSGGTTTVAIAGSILDTEGQETTTQAALTIPAA